MKLKELQSTHTHKLSPIYTDRARERGNNEFGGFWASAASHSPLAPSTPPPFPPLATTRWWLLQQDKPISICFKCFANQKPNKGEREIERVATSLQLPHACVSASLSLTPCGFAWLDCLLLSCQFSTQATKPSKSFRSHEREDAARKLFLFAFCIFAV